MDLSLIDECATVAQRQARLLRQLSQSAQQAGFLEGAFDYDDPEDFNAVELVGLRRKERATLLDSLVRMVGRWA